MTIGISGGASAIIVSMGGRDQPDIQGLRLCAADNDSPVVQLRALATLADTDPAALPANVAELAVAAVDVSVIMAPVGGAFRTELDAPNAFCGF